MCLRVFVCSRICVFVVFAHVVVVWCVCRVCRVFFCVCCCYFRVVVVVVVLGFCCCCVVFCCVCVCLLFLYIFCVGG